MKYTARFILSAVLGLGLALTGSGQATAKKGRSAPESDDEMRQRVVANERAGLDALKDGNVGLFASLLAEDAVLVDDHGAATKAQVVKNVANFRLLDYAMGDVKFVRLADTAGMIIYTLKERGTSHGHEFTATAYVSTVCALRSGKWQSVYSQETLARVAPPSAPALAPAPNPATGLTISPPAPD
jgi:hypothetical protein